MASTLNVGSSSNAVVKYPFIGTVTTYHSLDMAPLASTFKRVKPPDLLKSYTLMGCTFGPVHYACRRVPSFQKLVFAGSTI